MAKHSHNVDANLGAVWFCARRTASPLAWTPNSGASPSALIANPPWGADIARNARELAAAGYELATGQYDSYKLFVERLVHTWLEPGTPAAFILPDSIFLPEHEPLRALLIERSTLRLVARLGEGFFPGIYRGASVIVLSVGPPPKNSMVRS